jgi:threonine dehydrogenase-like Zn-dependent dehydrogenase
MSPTRTTRAWVQRAARSLSIEELPLPDGLNDGDATARVEASGICGTDYEQYLGLMDHTGRVTYPLIIGHEPVVRIEELTPAAKARWNVEVGDRVAVEPHVGCGVCAQCARGLQILCPRKLGYGFVPLSRSPGLWGSLAEHMLLTGNTVLHKMPDDLSVEDALLFNPLAAGFDWAVRRGGVGIGDDVLILGAGQRGLAAVIACVRAGANRVILSGLESDQKKLDLAERLGATDIVVVDPNEPSSLIDQIGSRVVDVAVEVVPVATQPIWDAIEAVRVGGKVVLGGIKGMKEIPNFVSDVILFKSLTIIGALSVSSMGYRQAIDVLLEGQIDFSEWHTHTLPFDRAEEGIRILGGEIDTGTPPLHITVKA